MKPETFISQIPSIAKEKEPEVKDDVEAEKQISAMSRTAGWKRIEEFISRIIEEMDSLNEQAIATGADFKTLGQNAVVISQVKTVLRRIINKVSDARDAEDKG